MSQVRVNFLNWKPDFDDFPNDGLAEAQNLVHEPEGYKPVHLSELASQGISGTILSVVTKTVGPELDQASAYIRENDYQLVFAINGSPFVAASTGYPLSFASTVTSADITYFDICAVEDSFFFVVEAEGILQSTGSLTSLRLSAYATINT